ncbi:MAG: exodeoxyribonuclease V subunit gamma [Thiotrichaceae bacterium]|nr:exodeoxyribonuclease V subunit gamma [Thiotrichaceae bacterium]
MFILHTSNRSSNLLVHLNKILDTPLSTPLATEQFLIQSQGMQRWVCQQLADQRSLWANFDFHYPGKFFTSLVDNILPQNTTSPLVDKESLLWQLESLLRGLPVEQSRVVYQYINDSGSVELKRYQLAKTLARLFDQYQFMRPEWFESWQKNEINSSNPAEIWQSYLWNQLEQHYPASDHSACTGLLWQTALDKLHEMPSDQARMFLPERLCVFGINAMSPLYMRFLKAIAQHIEVHFYLLNPAQSYWADVPTLKAKLLYSDEELHHVSNPILSGLGQQGRDFQQLMIETGDFELEIDSFTEDDSGTLLAQLKNDILHNSDSRITLKADTSLQLHCCHSRLREVEVIKDQVLACFAENPELTPRDIIIMAPDIQPYSAFIGAVFNDVPHSVADRSIVQGGDQPIRLFLDFLHLCQGRWELDPLLDFLENRAIYTRFGLLASDLELLRHWLEETRTRWGESGEHRQSLGFEPFTENTWLASLDRMLMGFMQSDDSEFCINILPFNTIEGQQGQVLGRLIDFFQLLSKTKKQLSNNDNLENWAGVLLKLSYELISSIDDFQEGHTQLTEIIAQLNEFSEHYTHKVTLEVIQNWLEDTANNHQSATGFMRGQLTFCSMLPMRAIPFKVIILMGMNESEFPHADRPAAFDLMAQEFRVGDKSYRNDERYQVLEIILSAEHQLIVSYIGQSQRDNIKIAPSIIMTELLDTLHDQYDLEESELVTVHPLHHYHSDYFSLSSKLFSYSADNLKMAKVLADYSKTDEHTWWEGLVDSPSIESINLDDLLSFYRHPQRDFLKNQLGIVIPATPIEKSNTEDFTVNGLDQYQIDQDWLEQALSGEGGDPDFYRRLKAEGRWTNGAAGQLLFNEQAKKINTFVSKIKSLNLGEKIEPKVVDCKLKSLAVHGYIHGVYENALLIYRHANLKTSDYINAWIRHCIVNIDSSGSIKQTYLFGKNQQWQFGQEKACDYQKELDHYLNHYLSSRKQPSALYIKPALAYQEKKNSDSVSAKSKGKAVKAAEDAIKAEAKYDLAYTVLYPEYSEKELEALINKDFIRECELLDTLWLNKKELVSQV